MNIFNPPNPQTNEDKLIKILSQHITPHRWDLMQKVIKNRTRYVTLVLEDIYQSHNAAAVIRSCDGLGIQDIHVIENRNPLQIDDTGVTMGADKWIQFHYYNSNNTQNHNTQTYINNTQNCLTHLKNQGYKIVATTLDKNSITLEQLPINQPLALMIGTEKTGLSQTACQMADYHIKLPMYGFTQSYNLSVCAALCLHSVTSRIRNSEILWQLSNQEQSEVLLNWLKKCVIHWEKIISI